MNYPLYYSIDRFMYKLYSHRTWARALERGVFKYNNLKSVVFKENVLPTETSTSGRVKSTFKREEGIIMFYISFKH